MVKRILSIVGREISGLHEAAYLLAGSAFLSQLLALIRDRLFASSFGAGGALDAYYAAFRVPDALFVTVSSLVSTSILVPFLLERKERGEDDLKRSIDALFSAFFALVVIAAVAAFIAMPALMQWLFPDIMAGEHGGDLIGLSRIILLSPIFLGISNFLASITQIRGRFLIYAISPLLYNLGIIAGIVLLYPYFGLYGLGMGVAIGALLHALIQAPFVITDGLFPKIRLRLDWQLVRSVFALSIPRTVTLSSQQLTALVLVSFASFLGAGSISIFNLSQNLQSVPLSLIGASYSAAAFPLLARAIAEKNIRAFIEKTVQACRHIIFWSVPLSILFIVLRAQIVRTVLGAGQFDWSDTRLTAASLALFVVSAAAQGLVLLFVRAFYAEGKTSKPLLMNVVSALFTIALAYVLVKAYGAYPMFSYFVESIMKTDGAGGSAILMLPLAFSLGSVLNVVLHWYALSHEFSEFTRSMMKAVFQSLSSSIIGGFAAYQSLRYFDDIFDLTSGPGIFLQGLCAGIVGIIVTAIMLSLVKSPELAQAVAVFKEKVWRVGPVPLGDANEPHI
ncbi:MAG: lipid II flippase MurJ [Candidatus Paceibacterota bacterium]|jgi:putative peptidoglycan lipid II flippase